jgi:hypothetical protein
MDIHFHRLAQTLIPAKAVELLYHQSSVFLHANNRAFACNGPGPSIKVSRVDSGEVPDHEYYCTSSFDNRVRHFAANDTYTLSDGGGDLIPSSTLLTSLATPNSSHGSVEARSPIGLPVYEQHLRRAAPPASSAHDEQHCLRAARTTSSTACEQRLRRAALPASSAHDEQHYLSNTTYT